MYLTGTPKDDDNYKLHEKEDASVLQLLTILNISDTPFKVILTYFNCTIIITGLTIYFVIKYMTKY